jgi:hypothetical protein
MLGRRYVVQAGETLSGIAQSEFGAASEWRRIFYYNNRPEVVRLTGTSLPDPNRIAPGQVLLLPEALRARDGARGRAVLGVCSARAKPPAALGRCTLDPSYEAVSPVPRAASARDPFGMCVGRAPVSSVRSDALPPSAGPFTFQYDLSEVELPPIVYPYGTFEISMSGSVVLSTLQSYPVISIVDHHKLELNLTQAANQAYASLTSEVNLSLDPRSRTLRYSSLLVSQAGAGAAALAVGLEVASDKPFPVLRFEYRFPTREGLSGSFRFWAVEVAVTIDLALQGRLPLRDGLQSPVAVKSSHQVRPAVREPDALKERSLGLEMTTIYLISKTVSSLVSDFLPRVPRFSLPMVMIVPTSWDQPIAPAQKLTQVPRAPLPAIVHHRVQLTTRAG